MENKSKEERNKKIHENAVELFNKQEIPAEFYHACGQIYWLHTVPAIDINDAVKYLWAVAEYHEYKVSVNTFMKIVKKIEEGLTHEMEWINESLISEEEHGLRKKAIELLINIMCDVKMVQDMIVYIIPITADKEQIIERINKYKKSEKYSRMFEYKSRGAVFFDKFYEQFKAGVPLNEIKVDDAEVDKEFNEKVVSNIKNIDKRVKNRDIEMIDVETGEVVEVFRSRNECIEKTGISKGRLSQCIDSAKDTNRQSWNKWKNKNDGKRYYFHEILKL